jgi:hypothetical chaperone protein
VAELRGMKSWYAEPRHHARLMTTVEERLGHALAAAAEQAKIDVATGGHARHRPALLEAGLAATLDEARPRPRWTPTSSASSGRARCHRWRQAGVAPQAVDALYFTGGSTGLKPLVQRIAACFPAARAVRGDRFASVAQGLGLHARAVFGA